MTTVEDLAPRINAQLPLSLSFEGSQSSTTGVSSNLSRTGVLVESSTMEPPGTVAHLEFQTFEAKAEVIWTRETDEGTCLLGMRFVHLERRDAQVLARFIDFLEDHTNRTNRGASL